LFGRVRACCPNCGEVEVRPRDVIVAYCLDPMRYSYQFACPNCTFWTFRKADPSVIAMLVRAGARLHRTRHPSQTDPGRGPITDGELNEFLRALEQWPTAPDAST
jgi:hypothetical protein